MSTLATEPNIKINNVFFLELSLQITMSLCNISFFKSFSSVDIVKRFQTEFIVSTKSNQNITLTRITITDKDFKIKAINGWTPTYKF